MLDRNQDWVEFRLSIMSFRRKWVSDTNLSKLLHETIEKKQANKQRKLPDFCKDAILSATIKKISSAMVIDKNLPCCGKEEECFECGRKSDDQYPPFSDQELLDTDAWENDSDAAIFMNIDSFDMENTESSTLTNGDCDNRTQWRAASAPHFRPCASPKRKRQPSSDGTDVVSLTSLDTVIPHASPRKKRREGSTKSEGGDFSPESNEFERFSPTAWFEEDLAMHHSPNNHIKGQRSQSLPHLTSFLSEDSLLLASQENFPSPKSVVNSISELSIRDCWEPTTEGSWCIPNNENGEPDPLELNGFFQELKSVTVHPS